jgi:hypothetical protein
MSGFYYMDGTIVRTMPAGLWFYDDYTEHPILIKYPEGVRVSDVLAVRDLHNCSNGLLLLIKNQKVAYWMWGLVRRGDDRIDYPFHPETAPRWNKISLEPPEGY